MSIINSMIFPRMMTQNTLRILTVHANPYFCNLIYFRSLTFLYASVESLGLVGIPTILSFTTFILSIGAILSSTEGSSPHRKGRRQEEPQTSSSSTSRWTGALGGEQEDARATGWTASTGPGGTISSRRVHAGHRPSGLSLRMPAATS